VEALASGFPATVVVGDFVSIGAGAVLRSCTLADNVDVGAGSVVNEGCVIEENVKIEPGSVVLADTYIPSNEKWAGNPAVFVSKLTEDDVKAIVNEAKMYAIRRAEVALQYCPMPDDP